MPRDITVQKARKILGDKYNERTDEEIQQIIDTLQTLADITVDVLIKMPPNKRKGLEVRFGVKNKLKIK